MTDIVERLRERKATWQEAILVMEEAADEIERLQARVAWLEDTNSKLQRTLVDAAAPGRTVCHFPDLNRNGE